MSIEALNTLKYRDAIEVLVERSWIGGEVVEVWQPANIYYIGVHGNAAVVDAGWDVGLANDVKFAEYDVIQQFHFNEVRLPQGAA